jgi:PAS domain-containing protein
MEDVLSRLVDALPGVVWTARPDGLADFFNRRWYEYTGFSEAETFRQAWQTTMHADDPGAAFSFSVPRAPEEPRSNP